MLFLDDVVFSGDAGEFNALLILNVLMAPTIMDVGDIWTIELLLCLLNLQITLFPLRCSLRHLALSSHLPPTPSYP